MRCGHLFNGIGGFALAAHWMGWNNVMHCEIDSLCNKVMNYHFPNSFQHEDIRTTDFTIWRGKLNLITGGFPCQPYSTAGKRKGKDDDRHLWPQMLRAIREIQPGWIVGENVRGLTNWNGGLVFDEVQADLETEGYEVLPFLLPAAGVGAPHRRDRIWFVAYAISRGGEEGAAESIQQKISVGQKFSNHGECGIITNTGNIGLEGRIHNGNCYETGTGIIEGCEVTRRISKIDWANFPTQSPVCGRDDGLSGRLADITFSKWRRESIKALGNSVVPQVVYQIFKAIEQ